MKRIVSLLLVVLFAVSVVGCAKPSAEKTKVKCPACGYEFQVPMGG